jgi:protocatechuate 3,4-dioxygenase beta subunit
MRRLELVVGIIIAFVGALRAQSMSARSSFTVTGRVVADDSGEPVPNARVTTNPTTNSDAVVLAGSDGRFVLTAATAPARLEVSKTGFATETVPAGMLASIGDIHLRRAASVAGRIVDAFGQPVVDAYVAIEPSPPNGPGPAKELKSTETDDRGEYRIGGLAAGDFLVSVTTIDALATGSGMQFRAQPHKAYFPGTATPEDARPVHVTFGEERTSVDIVAPGNPFGGPSFVIGGPGIAPRDPLTSEQAVIRGRVVEADGRGLAYAFVRLFPPDGPFALRAMRADSDGRFEFTDLDTDRLRVSVFVPGHTVSGKDTERIVDVLPGLGVGIPVPTDHGRDSMTIVMTRLGVLAGRVVDELGDPVEGARVQLLTIKYQAGRRRLVDAGFPARMTNDRGEYRVHDVLPGSYLVGMSIGSVGTADVPGYTRTYFPGTSNPAEAQFVPIADTDQLGVDVMLARTRTALVSGHIYGAKGEPSMGGHVEIRPTARSGAVGIPVGARLRSDGAFEFPNVTPGEYVIEADHGKSNESAEGEFGTAIVTVGDGDVRDVVVQMSAGSSVAGRITFDTDDPTTRPARSGIWLSAIGVDPDRTPSKVAVAPVREDWTFGMTGLNGPRRLDLISAPPGWMLKEIRVRGIDVTDRPMMFGRPDQSLTDVEVVLTDRLTRLSGSATFENGRQAVKARVVVFSTDRDRWYPVSRFMRQTLVGPDGVFVVTALPPGSYYAAVVARLPDDGDEAWRDPEFLEALVASSQTVTLTEGDQRTLRLRLSTR